MAAMQSRLVIVHFANITNSNVYCAFDNVFVVNDTTRVVLLTGVALCVDS